MEREWNPRGGARKAFSTERWFNQKNKTLIKEKKEKAKSSSAGPQRRSFSIISNSNDTISIKGSIFSSQVPFAMERERGHHLITHHLIAWKYTQKMTITANEDRTGMQLSLRACRRAVCVKLYSIIITEIVQRSVCESRCIEGSPSPPSSHRGQYSTILFKILAQVTW
jgi:hypothetical protein